MQSPGRLPFGPADTAERELFGNAQPRDLSLPESTAGERRTDVARGNSGSRGLVPLDLSPPEPERKTKLGRAIEKAAQPDCRDAYAALGLLALPFLIKDTLTDTGCRW